MLLQALTDGLEKQTGCYADSIAANPKTDLVLKSEWTPGAPRGHAFGGLMYSIANSCPGSRRRPGKIFEHRSAPDIPQFLEIMKLVSSQGF